MAVSIVSEHMIDTAFLLCASIMCSSFAADNESEYGSETVLRVLPAEALGSETADRLESEVITIKTPVSRVGKDEYKTPEDQLFLAESGFGCRPNSRGRKAFGKFLKDGEETHYQRSDILGIIKDEHLPEWAKEKLDELAPDDEDESEGMTMGGL